MKLIKLSVIKPCKSCHKDILKDEHGYKDRLGYMHFNCGYKAKKTVKEVGIGNYCLPAWIGFATWYNDSYYQADMAKLRASTWAEF